jgi:alpha-beta hydrolase superfamily lysophospholipase
MAYSDHVLALADGARLHTWRRAQSDATAAHIVLVHGFGEHSGRYHELTEFLFQRGLDITGFDQRGHGRSSGPRGHVNRFTDYERDLSRVIESVIARGPRRLFLVAHSMGGLITLRYLASQPRWIAGAVVSAPMLGFAVRIPKLKLAIGRASGFFAPRLRMPNEIDPGVLSRDPEVGRVYAADPLVHRVVSARWFSEATRAMDEMAGAAPAIKAPVLVMHGTDDKLAGVDATRRVFDLLGSSDKQLIVYPGFYHELFNEPDRHRIFDAVGDWLSQRSNAHAAVITDYHN